MQGNVTVILRGYTYELVRLVCEVLTESKHVKNVEITMNTEGAVETIEKIVKEFKGKLSIGAGTVVNLHDLSLVGPLGIEFALSPIGFTEDMHAYCRKHNIDAIPAAFTPTEIWHQYELGAKYIKIFPANELSHSYAKKVCEPLGKLPLMAVGGVNATNVKEILTSGGYAAVGSAGGIFKKEDIKSLNKEGLKASLEAFEAQLD